LLAVFEVVPVVLAVMLLLAVTDAVDVEEGVLLAVCRRALLSMRWRGSRAVGRHVRQATTRRTDVCEAVSEDVCTESNIHEHKVVPIRVLLAG